MNCASRPVLGQHRAVAGVFVVALMTSAATVLWQLQLRNDVVDASQLKIFFYLYLFQDYPAAWLSILVLLLGLAKPLQRAGMAIVETIGRHPVESAASGLAILAAGAFWVYYAYPLCMDEYAPYLQSQVFAEGHLTGRLPPPLVDWLVVPGFQNAFLDVSHATGQVVSIYLPGFALLLSPFSALGVSWLANPVIGALSVLVVYSLALRILGHRLAAGAAAFMAVASPAFTVNAMSFYSMPAHLLCNATFALLLLNPAPLTALAAGLVGGLAVNLHNPVPHSLFALPWLLWLCFQPGRSRLLASVALGYAPWIVVWLGWQHLLGTMDAPSSGAAVAQSAGTLQRLMDAARDLFVMPNEGILAVRLIGISKVWLWAVPALLVVAGIGFWNRRGEVHFKLLLASSLITLIGYLFVPFDQGHGWGFRYFHSAWFVIPIFAASVFRPAGLADDSATPEKFRELSAFIAGTSIVSLVIMTGYFAWQVHGFIGRHLAQLPSARSGTARVLIIDPAWGYYAWDLVQNDPFLRGPVIKMVTHGPEEDRRMMARHFPDLVFLGGSYRGSVWGIPAASQAPDRGPDSAGKR